MELPPIAGREEWQRAYEALQAKEKETWEDSPAGYPQTPPYAWWRPHDAYGVAR